LLRRLCLRRYKFFFKRSGGINERHNRITGNIEWLEEEAGTERLFWLSVTSPRPQNAKEESPNFYSEKVRDFYSLVEGAKEKETVRDFYSLVHPPEPVIEGSESVTEGKQGEVPDFYSFVKEHEQKEGGQK
jgi:hypothetical protein